MADRTAAQQNFVEEMTRKHLVSWCDKVTRGLHAPVSGLSEKGFLRFDPSCPYMQHGVNRKSPFLSTHGCPDGYCKILATGWAQGTTFLKR